MAEKIVKQNGVIWFDKTGLSIYLENKPFIRLNFTPDIFSNLEIIDKVKFENLIRSFIKQNNLYFLSFILILTSDVLFEKDWSLPLSETQTKEESDFIDSIPFEDVISHSWIKDSKKKMIATNQEFIYFFRNVFEKDNGSMIGAFPYSLFGANVRNESVKEIWKKLNTYKTESLYDIDKDPKPSKVVKEIQKNKNADKSLTPVLIVIFIVLVGLLGYLMIRK